MQRPPRPRLPRRPAAHRQPLLHQLRQHQPREATELITDPTDDHHGGGRDDLPPLFPVVDVGTTIDADGDTWPTAVIDAGGHPAVADLARVHAVEGVGDVTTHATVVELEGGTVVLLGVTMTSPVRAAFGMAFRLPQHRPALVDAAATGRLAIATTPPERAAVDHPLWLAVDIDGEQLAPLLDAGLDDGRDSTP